MAKLEWVCNLIQFIVHEHHFGKLFRTRSYAVDHCGLRPESHRRFLSHWCAVMNRIAVGPPKERNMELLALIEAGLVAFGMGPNPEIGYDHEAHRYTLSSTAFAEARAAAFDVFVRAKIDVFEPE
jgi:hypothetical protein